MRNLNVSAFLLDVGLQPAEQLEVFFVVVYVVYMAPNILTGNKLRLQAGQFSTRRLLLQSHAAVIYA